MRTRVYIDGFNLYYGCVKGSPHKWLNLPLLCDNLLPLVLSLWKDGAPRTQAAGVDPLTG